MTVRFWTPAGFFSGDYLEKAVDFYERRFPHYPPLLDDAPVEWEQATDAMPLAERREAVEQIDGLLDRAARLRGYLAARSDLDHDEGHDRAVKASNQLARVVRRALGYRYPLNLRF